jgi:uncharacterized alpha-E superfamily protein
MLSRTADHVYWLGRYAERAENLARTLDVQYRRRCCLTRDATTGRAGRRY